MKLKKGGERLKVLLRFRHYSAKKVNVRRFFVENSQNIQKGVVDK
jgi:hypothetical protein